MDSIAEVLLSSSVLSLMVFFSMVSFSSILSTPLSTAAGAAIEGLLRNVWWEGLSNKMRIQLKAKGLRVAHDAILIDARSTPGDDLGLALFILVTLGVITAGTTLMMYLKFRRI